MAAGSWIYGGPGVLVYVPPTASAPPGQAFQAAQDQAKQLHMDAVNNANKKAAAYNKNKMSPGDPNCDAYCQWEKSQEKNKNKTDDGSHDKTYYKWDAKQSSWIQTTKAEGQISVTTNYNLQSGTFPDGSQNSQTIGYTDAEVPSSVKTEVTASGEESLGPDLGVAETQTTAGIEKGFDHTTTLSPPPGGLPPGVGPQFFH